MIPLKTSTVVTGQQNRGETRLDFSNGASKMMLETIFNLLLPKLNGKNNRTCKTGDAVQ
jgi:hypothetical protein